MEWYEILSLVLILHVALGALLFICIYDYKYKIEKMRFDEKRKSDIIQRLDNIYNKLNDKEGANNEK